MNVFGVGPTELFLVLIVVLVLFGPDRLPEIAKRIAGASREIRDNLNSLNDQMNTALETSMEVDKARMTLPAETKPGETSPAETGTETIAPAETTLVETAPAETPSIEAPDVNAVAPEDNRILKPDSDAGSPPTPPSAST